MCPSSAVVQRSVRTALAAWIIALCASAAGRVPGAGQSGALNDRPTSYASLPDRLELSCEWSGADKATKRFFIVVPPDAQLKPRVLEARARPPESSTSATTAPLANLAEWLNSQATVLSRMFSNTPVGYFRHYRVVEIRLNPVFRRGAADLMLSRIRWVYPWGSEYRPPKSFRDETLRRRDQGFGNLLPRLIANPDALPLYADPDPPPGEMPPNPAGLTFDKLAAGKRPTLRLDIDKKALYRLDLNSVSLPEGAAKPRLEHVHLYNLGRQVPLYLHTNPKVPGSPELIFYGVPSDSKYTIENRYWLSENPAIPERRMAEAPVDEAWKSLPPEKSFPEALTVEQDNDLIIHADNFLTISDFRWVWGEIPPVDRPASMPAFLENSPKDKVWFTETSFTLPGIAEPAGKTQFSVSFYLSETQLTQPVRVEVRINRAPPQLFTLQKPESLDHSFVVANQALNETSNTLRVRFMPGRLPRGESVYFDRFVAHYRRRFEAPAHGFTFAGDPPTTTGWRHYAVRGMIPKRPLVLDVADAAQPRVIHYERDAQGVLHFGQKETHRALYRVLSLDEISTPAVARTDSLEDVAKQDTPIDYLIISHSDFLDLLDPLVAAIRKAGWRVRVVDVENVYASFSWGLSGPEAIKEYLAYTLRHWPGGGPTYVLFVGDCTSDYRNDFRNNVKNFVPTYTLERGPRAEKWASEHWFTTLCGLDDYSDIILGRLSVNSRKDAKAVIDKIARYRTHPLLGPWRRTVTYVADGGESFALHSEQLRTKYKSPVYVGQRIYLDEYPWEDNFYLPPSVLEADVGHGHMAKVSPVTTTEILDMFNRGSAFVSYRGHGSPNIWSDARIWFGGDSPNSDILMLRNGGRLPFLVNLTCNSGAIDYPDPPWNLCISEDFHRSPTGGAVALFVPTGPGIPSSHLRLSEELHRVMFDENVRAFGDIVLLAKYRYLLQGYPLEMIKMFLLLGDPSCRIQLPDETIPLALDRRVVSALRASKVRVSGRADLGVGQKGIISLYSPKEREVYSADLAISPDGRFEQVLDLKPTDDAGTWTVRTYCWNETTTHDVAGWAEIRIARPDLALERFEIERSGATVQDGDPTTFVCVVANRSALSAQGVAVAVSRSAGENWSLIGRRNLKLSPGEKRTVRFPWKATEGVFRFKAALSGPAEVLGDPPPGFRTKTMDLAVIGTQEQAKLALLPRSLRISIARAGNRFMRQTTVVIGSFGTHSAERIEALLTDETGTTETRNLAKLEPGSVQTLLFSRPLGQSDLPRRYSIRLTYLDNPTSETRRTQLSLEVKPDEFPDLTIAADRIRFTDEGNRILFGDPTPTDGQTVFIDVPVRNIGGAPAERAFSIEAFDGDPKKGGKRLQSGVTIRPGVEVAFLDAGAEKTLRLRWDPVNNAGSHQIYFRVDGDQRITESNEANNMAVRPLRVLTKGKLATEKIYLPIPTFSQARQHIQPLDALVMNDGETTVRMVLVEYFLGPIQTAENKIGEVLVPQIGPKSKMKVRLNWKYTPELWARAGKEKFSFLARLKGSTQRVTSVPQQ